MSILAQQARGGLIWRVRSDSLQIHHFYGEIPNTFKKKNVTWSYFSYNQPSRLRARDLPHAPSSVRYEVTMMEIYDDCK